MSERIDNIRNALETIERCKATHVESVPVREMFGEKTVWEGVVEVFSVTGMPGISRCYAWTFLDDKESRFVTVRGTPPVTDAQTAVRASIMAARRSDRV